MRSPGRNSADWRSEAVVTPPPPDKKRGVRGKVVAKKTGEMKEELESADNPVALKVTMQALPDGTSYPGNVVLSIPSSKIEVRIAKSNYQRLAP